MALSNIKALPQYLEHLYGNQEEVHALSKEFLINVTKFFRDEAAFEALANRVIPVLVENKDNDDLIKIWVVGCSTGEEAYSIAIAFDEYLSHIKSTISIKIFATDVDKEAAEIASAGSYPLTIADDVSPDRLEKYFVRDSKKYQVTQYLRKMVIFAHHDVAKDPPFGKIDLLSCRNMLIYMNPQLQKKVLSIFNFSLNLNGFLFLGGSENPGDFQDYLVDVSKKWKIYKKVKANGNGLFQMSMNQRAIQQKTVRPIASLSRRQDQDFLVEVLNDAILEEYDYAGVFITETFDVVQAMGNFRSFLHLPERRLNLNLMKMLPDDVALAIRTSLGKAVKQKEKVALRDIKYKHKTKLKTIRVIIKPFFEGENAVPDLILILFKEEEVLKVSDKNIEVFDSEKFSSARISELESELKETREMLQATVEEHETANEELQSANEELISANEELQSTNEELQSLNEELHTVNTEHQVKIKELIELNDDLNNYFKSTDIAQIFLDKNLVIRKFNPAATNQINLIETDIGRSVGHISNNISKYDGFLNDIRKVMDTYVPIEREIQTVTGKWYQMKILGYVRQDKKNDGAVITFVDITRLKELNALVTGVMNSSGSAIVALKAIRKNTHIVDFECSLLNEPAEKLVKTKPSQVFDKSIREIGGFLNSDGLFEKYVEVVEKREPLIMEYHYEDEWYDISAVAMEDGIALTISNITERKASAEKLKIAFEEIKKARHNLQKLNEELERRVLERTNELTLSEERFRILSLATNDVVRDWDIVSNHVWWNQGLKNQFGYDREIVGQRKIEFWHETIHADDKERVIQKLYDVINSDDSQWSNEYRFITKEGRIAYVLDRGYLLKDENGNPYRMISSMVDLTDLKNTQENLKKTNQDLIKINNDLDNFIYTASHDLKAPISNIEGLVNTMEDFLPEVEDPELKTIIELIKESIQKFKTTIKDLTDIAKIQKDVEEDEQEINLEDVIHEVTFHLNDLIREKNAKIELKLQETQIRFSKKNLRSIIYNLLSNAIKYHSPDRFPEVNISSARNGKYVKLIVKDNGLGLDETKKAKLFTMFKRFHDHVDGTGLGLYILKRIVDNAGGKIEVDTEVNKGTQFTVKLPLI